MINFKKALIFIALFSFVLCSCNRNRDEKLDAKIDQLRLRISDYKKNSECHAKYIKKRTECLDKDSKYLDSRSLYRMSCGEYTPWSECERMRDENEKLSEQLKKESTQCRLEYNKMGKEWEQCKLK